MNSNLTDYGDIIFDNSTDNIIRCEGGDDLISLSFGSDQVFGGEGNDEVSIYGDASDYFAQMVGAGYELLNTNFESLNYGKTIYLESVENISFYGSNNQTTYNSDIASYYNQYSSTNEPPSIDFISDQSVDENSYFSYQLNASDPDGDQLTFYGITLPDWLSISSSSLITGTPDQDSNGQYEISIAVSDGSNITSTSFNLTVNDNEPPTVDDFIGERTDLGSGSDKFYGGDEFDLITTNGGADWIMAGAGDDMVIVNGTVLSTDKNPFDDRSNYVLIDTGTGDDIVEITTDFAGEVQLVSGGGGSDACH